MIHVAGYKYPGRTTCIQIQVDTTCPVCMYPGVNASLMRRFVSLSRLQRISKLMSCLLYVQVRGCCAVGDVAIMLSAGWSTLKVAIFQLISGATAFVGLYIGISVSQLSTETQQWIFIVAAAMFLYIALADVVRFMPSLLLIVAVVYLHDITTYINIREISQMNHANKDLKEVKNL